MHLVSNQSQLEEVCLEFSKFPYVAIDTEFVRNSTYWPELCLVQMAHKDDQGNTHEAIIDVLEIEGDLSSLLSLFKNGDVVKVFHAMRQDVDAFIPMGNFVMKSVFDTQLASAICGLGDQVGYDVLVKKLLGVHLDKSIRGTDWRIRPLTEDQYNYAANDVIYLCDLYKIILKRLKDLSRLDWVKEEMLSLEKQIPEFFFPEKSVFKRLSSKISRMNEVSVCKELVYWREQQARKHNIPRNHFLNDRTIGMVSSSRPLSIDSLNDIQCSLGLASDLGLISGILECVRKGVDNSIEFDQIEKSLMQQHFCHSDHPLFALLKVMLKKSSESFNIPASMIAKSVDLEFLVQEVLSGKDPNDSDRISFLFGWRYDIFGKDALLLCCGDVALAFKDNKLLTVKITDGVSG